jgi:hypothetical protein
MDLLSFLKKDPAGQKFRRRPQRYPQSALRICRVRRTITATMVVLFLIFVHAGRQAVDGDSAVTGEGDLDGEEERPLFPIDPTRKKDTFCADE